MTKSEPQTPRVRPDGLQIEEKRGFQERFWIVERGAWIVFALIILLALLGFSGGGGYFSRGVVAAGEAEIDHPRISRWEASDEFRVTLREERERHRIEIQRPFSGYFQIEDIQPQPERAVLDRAPLAEDQKLLVSLLYPVSPEDIKTYGV
jgi:hypothetical protein